MFVSQQLKYDYGVNFEVISIKFNADEACIYVRRRRLLVILPVYCYYY
jgi:hypothetical protein